MRGSPQADEAIYKKAKRLLRRSLRLTPRNDNFKKVDIARRLKKTREEVAKFQTNIHSKMLKQQKVSEEIQGLEKQLRQAKSLEREIRLKRSIHARIGIDLTRLNGQKRRLEREIPNMEMEFQKMQRALRFGKHGLRK